MDTHIAQAYNISFEGLNILECGSHREGEETRMFRQKNNCYYIEANDKDYESMKRQPGVKPENVFHCALSDSDGEVEFTEVPNSGCSSFNHHPAHLKELQNCGCDFVTRKVQSVSYVSFLKKIGRKIDVLILDVEGCEPLILKNMKTLPVELLPAIICIEAGYDWLVRKQLLKDLGYLIDYYDYNNVTCHHSFFNIPRNEQYISHMNLQNPKFIWHNSQAKDTEPLLIYENEFV